jgi:DNA-binding winged helix-turn-helix (wHTH) protein
MTTGVVPMQESFDPASGAGSILSSGRYIQLGPFQIDQQREEITRDGERLKLQGKVYQVLMALLEKPGEVVTREELRIRLWPAETHVNYDANVNTTVNKLRLALGDSSDKPVYIETIPRKGYCLLVRPEASSMPKVAAPQLVEVEQQQEVSPSNQTRRKLGVRITFSMVLLILAGMLIGAAITTFWIMHFAPEARWH